MITNNTTSTKSYDTIKLGDTWQPVVTQDSYDVQPDRANPVRTTALRLEIHFPDTPCGIQEWTVD